MKKRQYEYLKIRSCPLSLCHRFKKRQCKYLKIRSCPLSLCHYFNPSWRRDVSSRHFFYKYLKVQSLHRFNPLQSKSIFFTEAHTRNCQRIASLYWSAHEKLSSCSSAQTRNKRTSKRRNWYSCFVAKRRRATSKPAACNIRQINRALHLIESEASCNIRLWINRALHLIESEASTISGLNSRALHLIESKASVLGLNSRALCLIQHSWSSICLHSANLHISW